VGDWGIVLAQPRPVHEIPGFDDGLVSVQDAGAQLAAPLLLDGLQRPVDRPLRLLDACAAPGGKTAHLLELADAEVTALEVDPQRSRRIEETLGRLGLQARVRTADAGAVEQWWDGQPFDGVLLDAPCTASGIVRRHPDVRWLRRAGDVAQLAAQQTRLLQALWPLVRPGGRLLYCTCSVFREEGQARIQAFLAHNKGAVLRPGPGHLLPLSGLGEEPVPDNRPSDHDGFFYAMLDKHPADAVAAQA
jgi:16S rRNA (cytosine967-C5)-methyltransferase